MWLLRNVHTYAGLLTFINFAVYGVVGLSVTFLRQAGQPAPVLSYQSFSVEPNLTDREVAERVRAGLKLSAAAAPSNGAIRHDDANNLVLEFRDANGRRQVTVLEKEERLRIETIRNSFWAYLYGLHTRTAEVRSGDWRTQVWSDYNEFAMWCLLTMIVTGFAMFLAARIGSRLAQVSLAMGCGVFTALYLWTR